MTVLLLAIALILALGVFVCGMAYGVMTEADERERRDQRRRDRAVTRCNVAHPTQVFATSAETVEPIRCVRPAGHPGTHCDDEGLWPLVGGGALMWSDDGEGVKSDGRSSIGGPHRRIP